MSAVISDDGVYRYELTRATSSPLRWIHPVTFVMLNPSTADATLDDNTIRRCRGYAEKFNGTELRVVNLFAYRATDPADLKRALAEGTDIVGPDNDTYLRRAVAAGTGPIFVAWGARPTGALGDLFDERVRFVASLSQVWGCLAKTKQGQPRHPLYLPKSAEAIPWSLADLGAS